MTSCKTCGAQKFQVRDGNQYCMECGEVQQDFIQIGADDFMKASKLSGLRVLNAATKEDRMQKKIEMKKHDAMENSSSWTTAEALTIIIQRWSHVLVQFGASQNFPELVLNLWAAYLNKIELAFIGKINSKTNQASKPKLGLRPSKRDIAILHEDQDAASHQSLSSRSSKSSKRLKKERKTMTQEEKRIKKIEHRKLENLLRQNKNELRLSFAVNEMSLALSEIEKKQSQEIEQEKEPEPEIPVKPIRRSKFVERWLVGETNIYGTVSSGEDTDPETVLVDDPEKTLPRRKRKSYQKRCAPAKKKKINCKTPQTEDVNNDGSEASETILEKWNPDSNRKISKRGYALFRKHEPYQLNFRNALGVLHLACRLNGERFLLLDLLRWCHSDDLNYSSAQYLLPEDQIKLCCYDLFNPLGTSKWLPSHETMRIVTGRLCLLLNMVTVSLPDMDDVIARLLKELCLPKDLLSFCSKIARLHDFDHNVRSEKRFAYPEIEINAAASIALALKLRWGLDGMQEDILSSQVKQINDELSSRNSNCRLFSWQEWHKHIMKIQWFNSKIDPAEHHRCYGKCVAHGLDTNTPSNHNFSPQRLAKYFWTRGIWRRTRTTTADGDRLLAPAIDLLLKEKDKDLKKLTSEPYLINGSDNILTGTAKSYLHNFDRDEGKDRECMKKIAYAICNTTFTDAIGLFLTDIKPLKKALNECGSMMAVYIKGNEEPNSNPKHVVLINPSRNIWLHPKVIDPNMDTCINNTSSSFQWLVKLMASICHTTTADICQQIILLETRLLRGVKMAD